MSTVRSTDLYSPRICLIFVSMPSGVEHYLRSRNASIEAQLIFVSMPSGVEHTVMGRKPRQPQLLIFVSMPSGVEHSFAAEPVPDRRTDLRLDAFGR